MTGRDVARTVPGGVVGVAHRRLAYLVGITLGLPMMAATWVLVDEPLVRWGYPPVALLIAVAGGLMLSHERLVEPVERVTTATVATIWVARSAGVAMTESDPQRAWEALTPWAFMGTVLVATFAYIVFRTATALKVSAAVAVTICGVLAARFVSEAVASGDWDVSVNLLRYCGYLTVILAFLHLLARSKDAVLTAELETERMRAIAYRDPLTGLPNRRALAELLDREVDPCRRTPLSVVAFDLDHFKVVNDTWGHATGDVVLQATGMAVQAQLRTGEMVGRWGGEEFLVVMPQATVEQAGELAERLRVQISRDVVVQGQSVTASFGVVEHVPGMGVEAVLAEVDRRMYAAKAGGRNRVVTQRLVV